MEDTMTNTIKPSKITKGYRLVRRYPLVPGETLTVISGRGPVTRLIKWEAEVSPFTEIGSEYLHNIATAISPDSARNSPSNSAKSICKTRRGSRRRDSRLSHCQVIH